MIHGIPDCAADDSETIRKVFQLGAGAGRVYIAYRNGEEALEAIAQDPPICFCRYRLAEMSGVLLCTSNRMTRARRIFR
jgi:hypothetical protein